jgi:hypothetical protein
MTSGTAGDSAGQAFTYAQLHGEACIDCGDTVGPLVAAGHRHVKTQAGRAPLGWAVVACPAHSPKESTR